jgi:hypothetical protein
VFAKHLPPSAGLPRVLTLDETAAAELAAVAEVVPGDLAALPAGPFDAVAGAPMHLGQAAGPSHLAALLERLRPGGRLILTASGAPEALLATLTEAGLIHCLVEAHGPLCLYRGERPPAGGSLARQQALAGVELKTPHVFLLVQQTPNKPAWKLAPDEPLTWQAATVLDPATGAPTLVAFSALVKAVAYMQQTILTGAGPRVNKVAKFPASAAAAWPLPYVLNPDFEALRDVPAGPPLSVDPQRAITGEER